MADIFSERKAFERQRLDTLVARIMIGGLTCYSLFMYSGAMAHGAKPIHPVIGHVGWVLAGLSPVVAYVSYRLMVRKAKSNRTRWCLWFLALGIFFLCQFLGLLLLAYALLPGNSNGISSR